MAAKVNMTGERFGHLVVIRRADKRMYGSVWWECRCDCGGVVLQRTGNLRSGRAKSCGKGCKYFSTTRDDLTGRKFGRWTVISPVHPRGANERWSCKCACGVKRDVFANSLRNGTSTSCGCFWLENQHKQKRPFNPYRFVSDTVVEIEIFDRTETLVAKTLIDSSDLAVVSGYRLYMSGSYVAMWIDGGTLQLHLFLLREALAASTGLLGDHVSRDKLDNRRCNLRLATPAQNSRNHSMFSSNKSGFIGVSRGSQAKAWQAGICANGVSYWLGDFDDPVEAAKVRDKKARELHGEFAVLNFPDEES